MQGWEGSKIMEAIKQIVRIPENHEIRIKVPQYVPKDEIMEVILIIVDLV